MDSPTEHVIETKKHIYVPCPLCGDTDPEPYVMAPSHYGPDFHQVTRCRNCGMIFTNPQLITYAEQVQNTGKLERHLLPGGLRGAKLQALLQLRLLERFAKPGRLFDFGCGAGSLVHAAIARGWNATGLDLNRGLVAAANAHWGSHALETGTLDDFLARCPDRFDAIVSNQVFEHLQHPVEIGRQLVDRLNPGGLILIDVPNVNQPQEWFSRGKTLDPTSHWSHFSTNSLSTLVERIGAEVVYAGAAPSFVGLYGRFLSPEGAAQAGTLTKRLLPPVGTGVCVIGRRARSRSGDSTFGASN